MTVEAVVVVPVTVAAVEVQVVGAVAVAATEVETRTVAAARCQEEDAVAVLFACYFVTFYSINNCPFPFTFFTQFVSAHFSLQVSRFYRTVGTKQIQTT